MLPEGRKSAEEAHLRVRVSLLCNLNVWAKEAILSCASVWDGDVETFVTIAKRGLDAALPLLVHDAPDGTRTEFVPDASRDELLK